MERRNPAIAVGHALDAAGQRWHSGLRRLSIRKRLAVSLSLLLALAVIQSALGLYYLAENSARVDSLYHQEVVPLEALDDAKSAMYRIRGDALEHILGAGPAARARLEREIAEQAGRFRLRVEQYRATRLDSREQQLLEDLQGHWQVYLARMRDEILPLSAAGRAADAQSIALGPAVVEFRAARLAMNALMDYNLTRASQRYMRSREDYRIAAGVLLIGALVVLLLGSLIAVALARSITQPLQRMLSHFRRIGDGNLDHPVVADGADEITELFRSLDRTRHRLAATLAEHRNTARRLAEEKERALVTLQSIGDGVATADPEGRLTYLNPVGAELLGCRLDDVAGQALEAVIRLRSEGSGEPLGRVLRQAAGGNRARDLGFLRLLREDHAELTVHVSVAPIQDRSDGVLGSVVVFRDVTAVRRQADEIAWYASHDPLTGLVNRRELERRLEQALADAEREGACHSLIQIDLDQFKIVNDTWGHAAGDALLREVAARLGDGLRSGDVFARLGGDEFAALLLGCPLDKAVEIAERMCAALLGSEVDLQGARFQPRASFGVVEIAGANGGLAEVLQHADLACYAAKDLGGRRVHVYRAADAALARRHRDMHWVHRLNEALADGRFCLYLQRAECLSNRRPHYVECLLRLDDPEQGTIRASEFVPAAERYRLMQSLDRWCVEEAVRRLARAGMPGMPEDALCALNVSGQSLGDEGFLLFLEQLLEREPVAPERLCFEITETAAVANLTQAQALIRRLRRRGCRFALDDFGSGLSSFAYLRSMDVQFLKLDGQFVRAVHEDEIGHATVSAIQDVARRLGLATVAEHVEEPVVAEAVRRLGVDYAQGYHFHRPERWTPGG